MTLLSSLLLMVFWQLKIVEVAASMSVCATDGSATVEHHRNPCSGSPPVYQGLSTRHYWQCHC